MDNLALYKAKTQRIKTILFSSLFGTAAIIAAFALLLQSTNTATADAAPSTITETGRYAMEFQAVFHPETPSMYFYTLVYDTSTGRSKLYYGSAKKGLIKEAGATFNLPSSPL